MNEKDCLFCYEPIDDCHCEYVELQSKKAFLNFFVDSMKEFSPKIAKKIPLYDAVDFVNDWFDCNFSDEKD